MTKPLTMPVAQDAFETLAQARHSVRAFLPRPVPLALLERLLAAARLAPSGANLQPGRFWAVEGAVRERLSAALCQAWRDQVPEAEDYGYSPAPCRWHCANARWQPRRRCTGCWVWGGGTVGVG